MAPGAISAPVKMKKLDVFSWERYTVVSLENADGG
jgi:hypothetical protein